MAWSCLQCGESNDDENSHCYSCKFKHEADAEAGSTPSNFPVVRVPAVRTPVLATEIDALDANAGKATAETLRGRHEAPGAQLAPRRQDPDPPAPAPPAPPPPDNKTQHLSSEQKARRDQLDETIASKSSGTGPRIVWLLGEPETGKSWLVHRIQSLLKRGRRIPNDYTLTATTTGDLTIFELEGGIKKDADGSAPNILFVDIAGESVKAKDDLFTKMVACADIVWFITDPFERKAGHEGSGGKLPFAIEALLQRGSNFCAPVLFAITQADTIAPPVRSGAFASDVASWMCLNGLTERMKTMPSKLQAATTVPFYSFCFVTAYTQGNLGYGIRIRPLNSTAEFSFVQDSAVGAKSTSISKAELEKIKSYLVKSTWPKAQEGLGLGNAQALSDAFGIAFASQTVKSSFGIDAKDTVSGNFRKYLASNVEELTSALTAELKPAGYGIIAKNTPPSDGPPSIGVSSALDWTWQAILANETLRRHSSRSPLSTTSALDKWRWSASQPTRYLGPGVQGSGAAPWGTKKVALWLLLLGGLATLTVFAGLRSIGAAQYSVEVESAQWIRAALRVKGDNDPLKPIQKNSLLNLPARWYADEYVREVRDSFSDDLISREPTVGVTKALRDTPLIGYPKYRKLSDSAGYVAGNNKDSALNVKPKSGSVAERLMLSFLGRDVGTSDTSERQIDETIVSALPGSVEMRAYYYLYAINLYRRTILADGSSATSTRPDEPTIDGALLTFESQSKELSPTACAIRSSVAQLIRAHGKFRSQATDQSPKIFAAAATQFLRSLDQGGQSRCGHAKTLQSILDLAFGVQPDEAFADYAVNVTALRNALTVASIYADANGASKDEAVKLVRDRVRASSDQLGRYTFWLNWTNKKGDDPGTIPELSTESLIGDSMNSPTRTQELLSAIQSWQTKRLTSLSSVSTTLNQPTEVASRQIAMLRAVQPLIWQAADERIAGPSWARLTQPEQNFLREIEASKHNWKNILSSRYGLGAIFCLLVFGGIAVFVIRIWNKRVFHSKASDLFLTPKYVKDTL